MCLQVFGQSLCEPLKACSALFILMIMSSSICRHFSTFPFVKLIEQFNELKSFRRREKKNTHPTIITVIKSGSCRLALRAPVTGLQPPWAWERQQGLRKVKQSILEPLDSWLFLVQAAIPVQKGVPRPNRSRCFPGGCLHQFGKPCQPRPCTWCGRQDQSLEGI